MAPKALHALRVAARELLRDPGATRPIAVALPAADLGIDDDRITGEIVVDAHAVSSVDGITVTGTVAVPWAGECRRCLTAVAGTGIAEVDEVYQDVVGAGDDAQPIDGDQIDLAGPVREYVLLEVPDDPLCREECAGLCPVCGIDRNAATCDCDTSVRDDRWAALDQLRLDD